MEGERENGYPCGFAVVIIGRQLAICLRKGGDSLMHDVNSKRLEFQCSSARPIFCRLMERNDLSR